MRILLTNDDGIQAPGLQVLMNFARTLGEVVVYAPKAEQSGKSHAIEIHKPFEVKPVTLPHGIEGYSVDSTPADCVRYAVLGKKEKIDLVLSGVNRGPNIGMDIIYSGTVGAVFEAGALGLKGIAVSTGFDTFDTAAQQLDAVWRYFIRRDLLGRCSLYNVNIPERYTGEIRLTRQGGPYYSDEFRHHSGDLYAPTGICVHRDQGDFTLDTDATLNGHISITPLTVDRTAREVFTQLRDA